jgi:hypothetical protein
VSGVEMPAILQIALLLLAAAAESQAPVLLIAEDFMYLLAGIERSVWKGFLDRVKSRPAV